MSCYVYGPRLFIACCKHSGAAFQEYRPAYKINDRTIKTKPDIALTTDEPLATPPPPGRHETLLNLMVK